MPAPIAHAQYLRRQASRVLGMRAVGLRDLLREFCGVVADKSLQRADWRERPLPDAMLR